MSQVSSPPPSTGAQLKGGVLLRTRSLLSTLSGAEQKVAELLLRDPGAALRASAETLAAQAGTSTATVVRFARSLDFTGLKDLRLALAVELQTAGAPPQPRDPVRNTALRVLEADMRALQETAQLLDSASLEQCVAQLSRASHVEVFAFGLSAPIALDAMFRLQRLGLSAGFLMDAHMQAVRAANLPAKAVALVISHSGRSPEALQVARAALAGGACVVALTSTPRAPLLDIAQLALVTATSEASSQQESMASRIAHLAIIDTLCASLTERAQKRSARALARARAVEEALLRPDS